RPCVAPSSIAAEITGPSARARLAARAPTAKIPTRTAMMRAGTIGISAKTRIACETQAESVGGSAHTHHRCREVSQRRENAGFSARDTLVPQLHGWGTMHSRSPLLLLTLPLVALSLACGDSGGLPTGSWHPGSGGGNTGGTTGGSGP